MHHVDWRPVCCVVSSHQQEETWRQQTSFAFFSSIDLDQVQVSGGSNQIQNLSKERELLGMCNLIQHN